MKKWICFNYVPIFDVHAPYPTLFKGHKFLKPIKAKLIFFANKAT